MLAGEALVGDGRAVLWSKGRRRFKKRWMMSILRWKPSEVSIISSWSFRAAFAVQESSTLQCKEKCYFLARQLYQFNCWLQNIKLG